jgi:thymidine kinase
LAEINLHYTDHCGWVEVITGPMFSGKTKELIRRIRRAIFASQKVAIFKPSIDNRYSEMHIVSHDNNKLISIPVDSSNEIIGKSIEFNVIGIDEAQFFDQNLISVCNQLANEGKRVIVAGLDMDYKGSPFGPMPDLMAKAEYVTKLNAICMKCGNPAHYSYRLVENEQQILLGEKDKYIPLCRKCFINSNQ